MAHPTRFERVTFAFREQGSTSLPSLMWTRVGADAAILHHKRDQGRQPHRLQRDEQAAQYDRVGVRGLAKEYFRIVWGPLGKRSVSTAVDSA